MNRRGFLKLLGGGLAVGAATVALPIDLLRYEQEHHAVTVARNRPIPELWSMELQQALRKSLVYAQAMNRKYEGAIRIQSVADVQIGTYQRTRTVA